MNSLKMNIFNAIQNLKKRRFTEFTTIIIISFVLYFLLLNLLIQFEKSSPGANIKNIFDAVWYSVVTLTTVGYGDKHPITLHGKIIGFVFIICSLGLLGLFIGKLTEVLTSIKENRKMGFNGTNFKNHIVIIGWDQFGQLVVDQLIHAENNVAIITNNKDKVTLIKENYKNSNIFVLFAGFDNFEIIKKANIENSHLVFINIINDSEKLICFLNLKKIFPNIKYVVTLDNSELQETFQSAGVTYVISKNEAASKMVASYFFEPDVAEFNKDLLASAKTDTDYDIKEFRVIEKNPYANKNYGDVFFEIKNTFNSILIGMSKINGNQRTLLKNPDVNVKIEKGDYLILITNGGNSKDLGEAFGIKEGIVSK